MTKSTETFFHDALSFSSKGEKQMSVLFHGVHVGVGGGHRPCRTDFVTNLGPAQTTRPALLQKVEISFRDFHFRDFSAPSESWLCCWEKHTDQNGTRYKFKNLFLIF